MSEKADKFNEWAEKENIDAAYAFVSGLDRRLIACWDAAWAAAMEHAAKIAEENDRDGYATAKIREAAKE